MNWTELVEAVAELSPETEQQLLDQARLRRSAATMPGPGTEHPPAPSEPVQPEPVKPEPVGTEPALAEPAAAGDVSPVQAATPPTAVDPAVADIVRPTETSSYVPFTAASPAAPSGTPSGLPRDDGVPTMDEIREKIEGRWARAEGQSILDAESEAGRRRADDEQSRAKAAEDVLAKIRASINKP